MRNFRFLLFLAVAMAFHAIAADTFAAPKGMAAKAGAKIPAERPFPPNIEQRAMLVDSLKASLKKISDPDKRAPILYDIFDLTDIPERYQAVEDMYQNARQAGDTLGMLNAMRLQALDAIDNDSVLSIAEQRAEIFPTSGLQREILTVIRVCRAMHDASVHDEKKRMDNLHKTLNGFDRDDKVDEYRRIEMLFVVSIFLQDRANNYLLDEYISQINRMISRLTNDHGYLRMLFYDQAATLYTLNGRKHDAVRCDNYLLTLVDEKEMQLRTQGRYCRSIALFRYKIYRRMLANYKLLSLKQCDTLYENICRIAEYAPVVKKEHDLLGVSKAYITMAHKRYAEAIPLLTYSIEQPENRHRRYLLLSMLIDAARNANDRDALLYAYSRITPILEARAGSIDSDRIIEYQILRDIRSLEASNERLSTINQDLIDHNNERMVLGAIISLAILLAITGWLFFSRRKARQASAKANKAVRMLSDEHDAFNKIKEDLTKARDEARAAERVKSDFINTITHEISEPVNNILGYSQLIVDSIEEKRRPAFNRFLDIIDLNAQLLRTLVNDILDVSELETSQITVRYKKISMLKLCQVAAEPLRGRLKPGVTLDIAPIRPEQLNIAIDTDPARTEQVLVNLISNAVKFTDKGSINVLYGIEDGIARFIIRDTGPGIPADKREAIFNRFERVSETTQGLALGLFICKLVARILGGKVYVDPDYTAGACFVFEIPSHKHVHSVDESIL